MMNPLIYLARFFPLPVLIILLIIVLANIFDVEWRYQPMIFLSVGLFIAGTLGGWFANSYENKRLIKIKKTLAKAVPNMDVIARFNMIMVSGLIKDTQKELGKEYLEEMVRLKSYLDSRDLTFNEGIRFIVKDYMERQGI